MLAAGQSAGKLLPMLVLVLALLWSTADAQDGGSGSKENEATHPNSEGDTLTDDEDFTGKVPVTFFATTTLSCAVWKDEDRKKGSQIIVNKMIVYVGAICYCDFDSTYVSENTWDCDTHAGTLLVSTNLSLPFNHQRSQLVGYLENWVKTEPSFIKTLDRGARATVRVVNFETTHSAYFPTSDGSGGDDGKEGGEVKPEEETPKVVNEQERDSDGGEGGSGSGANGNVLGSSLPVAMDIGTLFLSCVTGLAIRLLMNYS